MNGLKIEITNNGYIIYLDRKYVEGYREGRYVFNTPKDLSTWLNVYLTKFRAKKIK